MAPNKIKYYIIVLIVFLSWAHFACAELEITEIMYMPENGASYEWVEIYNNGSTSVDLNKYRFFHGETNSGPITLKNETTTILPPSKYAIIAKSLSSGYSWLDFLGSIFSAGTLSLPDNTEKYDTYIAISDQDENIIDYVVYDTSKGGSKDSKTSLSKIEGEWTSANPTPGRPNSSNGYDHLSDDLQTDDIVGENIDSLNIKETNPEIFKITTKIISPKIVTAGIPFSFNSITTTNTSKTYAVGRFVWNFGDGRISETNKATPFDYTYEYPGEYAVTLSYFDTVFSKTADATNKITIKVVESGVIISSVGDEKNPFIELENKSNYEIILSDWVVTGGMHYFIIPSGTTILPNKKIKLSPKITGFVGQDVKSVTVTNPNKEVVATYPTVKVQKSIFKSTSTYAIAQKNVSVENKNPQVINLNDLGGSAEGADVNISKSTYAWIGLFVIIGLGVASFWLVKRRDNVADYIDKEIRAEDMTIVE